MRQKVVIALTCTIAAIAACKPSNETELKDFSYSCSSEQLGSLQKQLAELDQQSPAQYGSELTLTDADGESLVRRLSMNYTIPHSELREVVDATTMPSAEKIPNYCGLKYAIVTAKAECQNDRNCKNFWGTVDIKSDAYQLKFVRALNECKDTLSAYVQQKLTMQNNTVASSASNEPSAIATSANAKPEDNSSKRKQLTQDITSCQNFLTANTGNAFRNEMSELDFAAKCESIRGGQFKEREPPFACTCPSGRTISFDPLKSRDDRCYADDLCGGVEGATWDATVGVCYCKNDRNLKSGNEYSIANTLKCSSTGAISTPIAPTTKDGYGSSGTASNAAATLGATPPKTGSACTFMFSNGQISNGSSVVGTVPKSSDGGFSTSAIVTHCASCGGSILSSINNSSGAKRDYCK